MVGRKREVAGGGGNSLWVGAVKGRAVGGRWIGSKSQRGSR